MKPNNYNNMKLVNGKLVQCIDRSKIIETRDNNPEEAARG